MIWNITEVAFVPKDHGAGTPQAPGNQQFVRDEESFGVWLLGRGISSVGGAYLAPKILPALREFWKSTSPVWKLTFTVVIGYILLQYLYSKYKDDVY